jgi:ELWxxDGT repeat protein
MIAALNTDPNVGFDGFTAAGNLVVFFGGPNATPWVAHTNTLGASPLGVNVEKLSGPQPFHGGVAFFGRTTDAQQQIHDQMWITDGTVAGSFSLGVDGGGDFLATSTLLYFEGIDAAHGAELWASDGTPAGTHLVLDEVPGPQPGGADRITPSRNGVIFESWADGQKIWTTDGTTAGTKLVAQTSSFGSQEPKRPMATGLGLALFDGPPLAGPFPLYRTDGTAAGTFPIVKGALAQFHDDLALTFGGRVWLGGPASGLVSTDGTLAGTQTFGAYSDAHPIVALATRFLYDAMENGLESIFASDGTPANTVALVSGGIADYAWAKVGNHVYLALFQSGVRHLWVTDGTLAGTSLFAPGLTISNDYPGLSLIGNHVYFTADDGMHGPNPWRCAVF